MNCFIFLSYSDQEKHCVFQQCKNQPIVFTSPYTGGSYPFRACVVCLTSNAQQVQTCSYRLIINPDGHVLLLQQYSPPHCSTFAFLHELFFFSTIETQGNMIMLLFSIFYFDTIYCIEA